MEKKLVIQLDARYEADPSRLGGPWEHVFLSESDMDRLIRLERVRAKASYEAFKAGTGPDFLNSITDFLENVVHTLSGQEILLLLWMGYSARAHMEALREELEGSKNPLSRILEKLQEEAR